MRVTYTYDVVKFRVTKSGKCITCGKPTRRSTSFEQTINPYNRNAAGVVKSREEIWAELKAEAEAWEPDFQHFTQECRLPPEEIQYPPKEKYLG